jgi:hypothetical protein
VKVWRCGGVKVKRMSPGEPGLELCRWVDGGKRCEVLRKDQIEFERDFWVLFFRVLG